MRHYQRHNRWDIFIHWFNAVCWILLFFTGLGLIRNEMINPVGQGYPDALRSLFGGGGNLLAFHQGLGLVWLAGFLLYLVFNFQGAVFFLKELLRIDPKRDTVWMIKKPVQMTLGNKGLKMLGMDTSIPEQGFYNMGQKSFGHASVAGSVVLAVTGLIMFLSQTTLTASQTGVVQWSILIHYVMAFLVFAGLLVHIYMAAISPDERPGFRSMFTGVVPEDYARHHHRLWYEKVKDSPASAGTGK